MVISQLDQGTPAMMQWVGTQYQLNQVELAAAPHRQCCCTWIGLSKPMVSHRFMLCPFHLSVLSIFLSHIFFCSSISYLHCFMFSPIETFLVVGSQSKRRKTGTPASCSISSRTRSHTPTTTAHSHGCEAQQSWFLDNPEVCHQHRTCLFYMLRIYPSFIILMCVDVI
jgi:hypothetical protein